MLIDSQRAENHASISLFEKYWRAEELDSLIHTPSDACLCYQANSVSVFFFKSNIYFWKPYPWLKMNCQVLVLQPEELEDWVALEYYDRKHHRLPHSKFVLDWRYSTILFLTE